MRRGLMPVLLSIGACLVAPTVFAQAPAASRPAPPAPGVPGAEGPQPSDLSLVGIIIREGGEPLALIEDRRSRKQVLYRVGALVGGGRVTKIQEDRVTLELAGRHVELRLPAGGGAGSPSASRAPGPVPAAAPQGPGHPLNPALAQIDRATLERLIGAPDLVMNVTPMEDRGVRVVDVRPATFFEAVGIRKGDVIRSVNGHAPGPELPLAKAVEQALASGMLRLHLERDGRTDVRYIQIRP